MKNKITIAVLALAVTAPDAHAILEAAALDAMYACNSVGFTTELVIECASRYPDQADTISTAFSDWLERNAGAAAKVQALCTADIEDPKRSQEHRSSLRARYEREVDSTRHILMTKTDDEWNNYCRGLPSHLNDADHDMIHYLPQ